MSVICVLAAKLVQFAPSVFIRDCNKTQNVSNIILTEHKTQVKVSYIQQTMVRITTQKTIHKPVSVSWSRRLEQFLNLHILEIFSYLLNLFSSVFKFWSILVTDPLGLRI